MLCILNQGPSYPVSNCHLILYHTVQTFNEPEKESFGKHCGKVLITICFNLDQSKILSFGNGSSYDKILITCIGHAQIYES